MKAIQLHAPALDNGGTRRDAGETINVGKGGDRIDADRAKALVDSGGAAKAAPAK